MPSTSLSHDSSDSRSGAWGEFKFYISHSISTNSKSDYKSSMLLLLYHREMRRSERERVSKSSSLLVDKLDLWDHGSALVFLQSLRLPPSLLIRFHVGVIFHRRTRTMLLAAAGWCHMRINVWWIISIEEKSREKWGHFKVCWHCCWLLVLS